MAEFYKNIPIIDCDGPEDEMLRPKGATFGLVPRDYAQDPESLFAPPSEIQIIPESEWDARFDEQERLQSSLEHMYLSGPNGQPRVVNLDQNGHGYCHTADTEVLTTSGFVRWDEYNWKDALGTINPVTHQMEFQFPFEKHIYEYKGEMIYSTNRRVNFGVTPDHQMYVRKWNERRRTLADEYSFVKASDMGWYCGLLHAPSGYLGTEMIELEVPGDRQYDGDDFMAMLGLIVSDGYAGGTDNTKNWVSFASFRDESRGEIAALAQRIGFRECPGRKGVWIRYDAASLASWVRANCYSGATLGAANKIVPEVVKCASERQIKVFLKYFDDRNRDGSQFYSASKALIDGLQDLHLRIGKRSSVDTSPAKQSTLNGKQINGKGGFTLTVGAVDRLCIDKKKHIEQDVYDGQVYCAAVPNHTLITRRDGTTLVSSNCWAYSTGHAIMMDRLRRNLPLVRVNPHATAAIIKRGRDEGGWCGLSAKFGREHGYAIEGNASGQWPLHSRDLRFDTPALRASMAKYKIDEDWVDLSRQVYDQNLTRLQLATCLLNNIPCPTDFAWWGHSVCSVRWVRIEQGAWGLLIINSWKGWGRYGLGVLRGEKSLTMGALAIRSTTA
jgi:hypothetical protein